MSFTGFDLGGATGVYVGGTPVDAVYYGTQKIWPMGRDYSQDYLTFEVTDENNLVSFSFTRNNLEYSLDDGQTWDILTAGQSTPHLSLGEKILWRQTNPTIITNYGIGTFSSTGQFKPYGNIMSLLYGDNFTNQLSLSGKDSVFTRLFENCTNIIDASNLILPATTLASICYLYMFHGCTSLTTAPELPATTLKYSCYRYMFQGCTSLTTAPELPATTLAMSCYANMFHGCTSLTTAPELPATTLAPYCYENMFHGCTSLTTLPELPATTLEQGCYRYMFQGCTSLTTAPELPATTLEQGCYRDMFYGCTSLTTAPELPATTLEQGCYRDMFYGCTSLEEITCLATNISAQDALTNWVDGVSQTGTFYKDRNTTWTTGTSGIPTGWTVVDVGELPYDEQYLTFEVTDENNLVSFSFTRNDLEYSTDDGQTWDTLIAGQTTQSLVLGMKILWRKTNPTISSSYDGMGTFSSTGQFKVYGNIMSLLYGDNFTNQLSLSGKDYAFSQLFYTCANIIDASNLILPATTLANYCYNSMFNLCTSLTTVPELPATTLATSCYQSMFYNCTSLMTAPELPATTLANSCYYTMFVDCTSLTIAPELPAIALVNNCYGYMFRNCSSLNYIKAAFTTNINLYQTSYTRGWVSGVASSGTYYKNSSATYTSRGNNVIPNNWTLLTYTP